MDKIFKWRLQYIKKRGEHYKREKKIQDAYNQYLPDRKKIKVTNIMLVIIVIAIVSYALANFWLQYHMGIEMSPTLTTCWFTFWGAEIVSLAGIKVTKVKNESQIDNSVG